MTRKDIERYVREHTGITTGGERDRRIDLLSRFRDEEEPAVTVQVPGFGTPPGFQKGSGTSIFTPASTAAYARYIGRAIPQLNTVNILWRVTTLGAAATYAEWGLCVSEEPVLAASLTLNYLTAIGYTDVASDVTSTGRKSTSITDFTGGIDGAHLWAVFTHQGSTGLVLRGGLPQEGGLMLVRVGSDAKPSTGFVGSQFDEVTTSLEDIWCIVQQVAA